MKISAKTPWYVGGLAFECQQCGRCCEGPEEGYVWVTPDEIAAIAAYLRIPEDQVRKKYVRRIAVERYSLVERKGNRDCVFLTAAEGGRRRCAIYPVRPMQCRTWPFWPTNLVSPDMWAEAGRRCIGINRGEPIPFDEIEARRLATRR
jgi:Fe-S-cluster containining protein